MVNLEVFYNWGVCYIILVYLCVNYISDLFYDICCKWKGLSFFGKELVIEMNNIGMLIDIFYVFDDVFY